MPKTLSEEHKRALFDGRARMHAEGRGNYSGIHSKAAREKASAVRMGHKCSPTGERHVHWKGEGAGYTSKHQWLTRHYPKTGVCEQCGRANSQDDVFLTDWTNISGKYVRDRSDYLELCRSCHRHFDYAKKRLASAPGVSG